MNKKINVVLSLILLLCLLSTYCYADAIAPMTPEEIFKEVEINTMVSLSIASIATILLCLPLIIFYIVCWWFIFKKANEKGWKAIIPLYNTIVSFKISGLPIAFSIVYIIVSLLPSILLIVITDYILAFIISLIFYVVLIVMYVILCIKLSEAFGHGIGFTIGLIILPIIFIPILAFGSSKYVLGEANPSTETSVDDVL